MRSSFFKKEDRVLWILDILCPKRFSILEVLKSLDLRDINEVRCGFTPEEWDLETEYLSFLPESPLFVRGQIQLPKKPFKFPLLAQT
ncbi:hypothetical protein AB3N59_13235 [Leptospira sp. WS92.C1]